MSTFVTLWAIGTVVALALNYALNAVNPRDDD